MVSVSLPYMQGILKQACAQLDWVFRMTDVLEMALQKLRE